MTNQALGKRINDQQFRAAQDKIDALTRKTRRGTQGTPEEVANYLNVVADWEAANALPQIKKVDRDRRDGWATLPPDLLARIRWDVDDIRR